MDNLDRPKRRYGVGAAPVLPAPAPPIALAPSAIADPRIISPREAIPLLRDPKVSPIVSLDTEFGEKGKDTPACRARLNGFSMGGGTPQGGFFATFFPFDGSSNEIPWAYCRDQILLPIISDPSRGLVEHPLKVDMQVIGQPARGIPRSAFKCRTFCTMSMVHIFDENLPKGLKELGECLLGAIGLASYKAVQKEIAQIKKDGDKLVKAMLKEAVAIYRAERASSLEREVRVDPSWPLHRQLALQLPSNKLLPREVRLKIQDVKDRVEPKLRERYVTDAEKRAAARFALYGAEDALLTIELFYYLLARIPAEAWPFVEFETRVCHPIVTEMEERGLKIDVPRLAAIMSAMDVAITALRADVIARFGFDPTTGERTTAGLGEEGEEVEFNPASTDQVAHVIWNVWNLRPPPYAMKDGKLQAKFTRAKDGLCSVDKEVLTYLAEHSPEPYATNIAQLRELGKFTKLRGSFVEPILLMSQDDPNQRLHSSFWPVGARTGRFSSSDPNAENIPRPTSMPIVPVPAGADFNKPPAGVILSSQKDKKTGETKKVWRVESLRRVFIAEPEVNLFAVVDLAQIENRFIAHESRDPALLELFRRWDCAECKSSGDTNEPLHKCPKCGAPDGQRDKTKYDQPAIKGFCLGKDIHSHTGYRLGFCDKYGPKVGRDAAKTFNHAFSYGMQEYTLARREGIEVEEAKRMLEIMRETYPGIPQLQWRVRREIEATGQVKLFDGHVRRFPIQKLLRDSGNFFEWEWEGTIREGTNVLAQGGTGILMKRAMIRLYDRFQTEPELAGMALASQVHDELILEGPKSRIKYGLEAMVWELEHAAPELVVPVIAEGHTGATWLDAK